MFLCSDDPYAWYRLSEAFREGWVETNLSSADYWFEKALQAKHHLALKEMKQRK